jgi:hypothetical protein
MLNPYIIEFECSISHMLFTTDLNASRGVTREGFRRGEIDMGKDMQVTP